MPPVLAGIGAALVSYFAVQTTVMVAVAVGLAATALYSVATMKIPKAPGTSPSEAKKMIRSPNQPFRTVYGHAMVSGPIVFAEEYVHESGYWEDYTYCTWFQGGGNTPGSGGGNGYCEIKQRWVDTTKKWLHLVIPVASHPSEGVAEVYFNDKLQSNWDHEFWRINVMDGSQQSQEDLPQLLRQVPSWKPNMLGKGITWVHIALRHSTKHFPNGIPNIKCLVKGKRVQTPFFSGFTNNAAAVLYDYLITHFNAKPKEINVESFQNDYAICGEVMEHEAEEEGYFKTPPIRYAIDGSFDWDEPHDNIMKKMLSACGGKLMFTNGQYHLQVAAYRGPVPTDQVISLSDLNGSVTILPDVSRNDRINKVTGQHLDPDRFYQQVDFTPATNQTYVDDDGEVLVNDINLEYVLNKHQAHRLANIVLKDNRFGITLDVPMNLRGFKYNVGLPVRFDEPELGYDQLEFMVVSWKLTEKNGLTLKLKQTSPDIYDDSVAVVSPKPPSTQLPDPSYSAPPYQITFLELEDDGTYDGLLMWAHPDINSVNNFQVVATSPGGEVFKFNTGKDLELRMQNMRGVSYTISVIAYNLNGVPSEAATITATVGSVKDISAVDFETDNFEITIRPKVSGSLPINTTFNFFRANTAVPDANNVTMIGSGTSYTDVGLEPEKTYHYYIQAVNTSAASRVFGPYSATTTNIPDKIFDLIKDEIPGQYTWVCYASNAFGANISATFNPSIHIFEGRAYNKATEQQSLQPADYQFIRIGEFITPEEQDVLDNLSQGKLPDGSGNLISEDDVLFKPGDLVQGTNIANGAITPPNLAIGSVTVDKVSAGAITTEKIALQAIKAPNLANESVVSDKLAASSVLASKIAAGAIETEKLAANAVTAAKIAADTITANQIAAGAITASELAANSVVAGKIAANAVTANTIAALAITADKIAANTITAAQIAADTITANQIAAGAITASELATNSVVAGKIAANAVTANTIAANAISSDKILANAITAAKINAGAITADKLSANSVIAGKIAANAITANNIQAGAITADKIAVTVVSPINNISESGNARGWDLQSNVALVNTVQLGSAPVTTLQFTASTTARPATYTEAFSIDHNAIYEVKASLYFAGSSAATFTLLGQAFNSAGAVQTVDRYHSQTLNLTDSTTSPSFYGGTVSNWRNMVCYIVGANVEISAVPKSVNATHIIKLRSTARTFKLGGQVGTTPSGTQLIHLYSPSVVKVGSGKIVADEIRANTLISSPTIEGGVINAGVLNGGVINGATGSFSGEVRAGKLVGALGLYTTDTGGQAMYLNSPIGGFPAGKVTHEYPNAIRVSTITQDFDRTFLVELTLTRAQVDRNYPHGLNDDIATIGSVLDCTTLAPMGDGPLPTNPKVIIEGRGSVRPTRLGYSSANVTTYLSDIVLTWEVLIRASEPDKLLMFDLGITFTTSARYNPNSTGAARSFSSVPYLKVFAFKSQTEEELSANIKVY